MLDLLYPQLPVPYLGSDADLASHVEMLPVVDTNGVVIAEAPRSLCHTTNLLHPVVHLHIIDRYSRIFLQKRSMTKKFYPGLWDTAVGGHVGFGECVEEALAREAGEELGLFDFNPWQIDHYVFTSDLEQELVLVFATVGGFDLHPVNDEVSEGRWWTIEEIEASIGKGVLTKQFESEFMKEKDKLLALL